MIKFSVVYTVHTRAWISHSHLFHSRLKFFWTEYDILARAYHAYVFECLECSFANKLKQVQSICKRIGLQSSCVNKTYSQFSPFFLLLLLFSLQWNQFRNDSVDRANRWLAAFFPVILEIAELRHSLVTRAKCRRINFEIIANLIITVYANGNYSSILNDLWQWMPIVNAKSFVECLDFENGCIINLTIEMRDIPQHRV